MICTAVVQLGAAKIKMQHLSQLAWPSLIIYSLCSRQADCNNINVPCHWEDTCDDIKVSLTGLPLNKGMTFVCLFAQSVVFHHDDSLDSCLTFVSHMK